MLFPRTVFKKGGSINCQLGMYSDALVKNESEFNQKLKDGYFATLPEAFAEEKQKPVPKK